MVHSITFPFHCFPPEEQISLKAKPVDAKSKIKNKKDILGKCSTYILHHNAAKNPVVIMEDLKFHGFFFNQEPLKYIKILKIFSSGNSESSPVEPHGSTCSSCLCTLRWTFRANLG